MRRCEGAKIGLQPGKAQLNHSARAKFPTRNDTKQLHQLHAADCQMRTLRASPNAAACFHGGSMVGALHKQRLVRAADSCATETYEPEAKIVSKHHLTAK